MILDQVFADLEKLATDVEQGAAGVVDTVKADVGTLFADIGNLVQSTPPASVQSTTPASVQSTTPASVQSTTPAPMQASRARAADPQQAKQSADRIRAFVAQHKPNAGRQGAQALGDGTLLKALLDLLQQELPSILSFIASRA